MLAKLSQYLPFVLIAILLLSQFQRGLTRPGTGSPSAARRTVTMLGAGLVLGMWIAVLFLIRVGAPDWTGALPFAAAAGVVYLLRKRLTAFPTQCRYCSRRLPLRITFGIDAAATARYEEGSCPIPGCPDAPEAQDDASVAGAEAPDTAASDSESSPRDKTAGDLPDEPSESGSQTRAPKEP